MTQPIRKPGTLAGKIRVADDFDVPLSKDILEKFASFGPDFMAEGRGDQEQAEREALGKNDGNHDGDLVS